jgi:hypothetical protein
MPQLQTALQEAFTEESLEAAKTECVVCLSAESVMALMPCGHRCACAYCAASLRICPICRCPVQEAKRIFGSGALRGGSDCKDLKFCECNVTVADPSLCRPATYLLSTAFDFFFRPAWPRRTGPLRTADVTRAAGVTTDHDRVASGHGHGGGPGGVGCEQEVAGEAGAGVLPRARPRLRVSSFFTFTKCMHWQQCATPELCHTALLCLPLSRSPIPN